MPTGSPHPESHHTTRALHPLQQQLSLAPRHRLRQDDRHVVPVLYPPPLLHHHLPHLRPVPGAPGRAHGEAPDDGDDGHDKKTGQAQVVPEVPREDSSGGEAVRGAGIRDHIQHRVLGCPSPLSLSQ